MIRLYLIHDWFLLLHFTFVQLTMSLTVVSYSYHQLQTAIRWRSLVLIFLTKTGSKLLSFTKPHLLFLQSWLMARKDFALLSSKNDKFLKTDNIKLYI